MRNPKRTLHVEVYKKLLGYTCAHPECRSGYDIEAHHVRPLKFGGDDKFWNLICLCKNCHRTKGLHSRWNDKMTELYVYKSMHELEILGFNMDEEEANFSKSYQNALNDNRNFTTEERFIANSMKKSTTEMASGENSLKNAENEQNTQSHGIVDGSSETTSGL